MRDVNRNVAGQHDTPTAQKMLPEQLVHRCDPRVIERIKRLIKRAADDMRKKIKRSPRDATNYNQLAWLIGNTEGDMNEAIKLSKKSLELSPDTGGYYDTLGRAYYGKGDYENAVENQLKAVELDPHSGQIQRQLKLFQDALKEKKAKK